METKDLMVGDWMQHANGKYYQVTRIDALSDGNIHFACGTPHLWEYNNKFSPVPLTKEILEKNGFEYSNRRALFDEYRMCFNEDTEDEHWIFIEIHPKNEHCDVQWVNIHYTPTSNISLNCIETKIVDCCVHHLQHTLRLCGIEKEIIL